MEVLEGSSCDTVWPTVKISVLDTYAKVAPNMGPTSNSSIFDKYVT